MSVKSKASALLAVLIPLAALAPLGSASAQMVLPGAVAPTPAGATVSPDSRPKRAGSRSAAKKRTARSDATPPDRAPAAKVPLPGTLDGQTLFLNGHKSEISFAVRDKALIVSHLVLIGERLSQPREECRVEVDGTSGIGTTDLGRPNGLYRVKLAVPACPIAFDVLAGAALAVGDPPSCEFKEADCGVAPNGLWGPQPGAIGADKVKAVEHDRAQAQAAVRTDFKLLVGTTKDKPSIMGYAREQAGFSSAREEICRDYAGEGRHGLCATRLTEARAAALRAKYEVEAARKELRKKDHARK